VHKKTVWSRQRSLALKAALEKEEYPMIHTLLGIALVIFVVWLLLVVVGHIGGFLINLLWILILVALVWWLLSFVTGRGRRI
jgi:hypothetical protein